MHLTSHLLDLARYADQFYSLYHGLTGRDVLYKNPGTSLRSYIVANIEHELTDLPGELETAFEECNSFCHDKTVIAGVNQMMMEKPYQVAERILQKGGAGKELNSCISRLNNLNRTREDLFSRLSLEEFDFVADVARNHRQALYLLRNLMRELESMLDETTGDQTA